MHTDIGKVHNTDMGNVHADMGNVHNDTGNVHNTDMGNMPANVHTDMGNMQANVHTDMGRQRCTIRVSVLPTKPPYILPYTCL